MNAVTSLSFIFLWCISTLLIWNVESWYFDNKMPSSFSRRQLGNVVAGVASAAAAVTTDIANAAPPIAVIAEELGYFPVQNKDGQVMYIPKRVKRQSSEQAIELAKILKERGVTMYGAYWCPHCSRQKGKLLGGCFLRNKKIKQKIN